MVLFGCFSVLILCLLYGVTSFNLEPRIPVIKFGKPGSYFGFSVAEHLTIKGNDTKISWLLVGAPLDQNHQPNTTKSGALWKCPVNPAQDNCIQIITDGKRTKYGKIDTSLDSDHLVTPYADEIKEGQWLGVSVSSQGPGKKAAVCAHRYIRVKGELQFGQGLCYTLSNELELSEVIEPCVGLSVVREHEEYGFCQVGTSSSLLDDDTLIVGSPGPYAWRGTVFAQDTSDDIFKRDNHIYMTSVEDVVSPVGKYSYLGMSVTSGNFFSENTSYVAGAPRSNGTGEVVIVSKLAKGDEGSIDQNILNLSLLLKLEGEQFGANFGYEVASADVNGDGLPDLLVGAPFYFSREEGGAVYLYLNVNHSLPLKYNVKLTGKQESQFGIAIANAGDLNKDGCQDIAIGSPYEGNGVVYIYMGDREQGLNSKPDQVITAETLPIMMKTFGYSLSGGIDLDANGYPDLLIGAYENSSVALIRSRPIIDIKTSIRPSNTIINIDPTKQGCDKDLGAYNACFEFQVCCIINSLDDTVQTDVHKVNYIVEAETFFPGRKYSRVSFDPEKNNIVDKTILIKEDIESCREHIVYLKNNTRDIQTPIKFQVTYRLVHTEPLYSPEGAIPDIDPVLNSTATTMFSANFLNDCGSDGVCVSDLVVEPKLLLRLSEDNKTYSLILGQEEEIRLSIMVDNYGESAYETLLFVNHSHSLRYVAVNISDKHVICTSVNKTTVTCMLENPFRKQPDGSPPITMTFDARALGDDDQSVNFTVWATSTSKELHFDKKPVEVTALVMKTAELSLRSVSHPEQVLYGGEVEITKKSALQYFDDIGTSVVHTYEVFNKGPWHETSVQVTIQWPHQLVSQGSQRKWLLYPEGIPTVDGKTDHNGECFAQDINPLNLIHRPGASEPSEKSHNETVTQFIENNSTNNVRRKRDEDAVKAEAYTNSKHVVNLSCELMTAKCIQFQCIIYKLGRTKSSTISVRARLWNRTLVKEFPEAGRINIASTAYISIPPPFNIHQNKAYEDRTTVMTIAYPNLNTAEIPLLYLIIPAIVGLIVLILFIIVLSKLRFFERNRPLSGHLKKHSHDSPSIVTYRNSVL